MKHLICYDKQRALQCSGSCASACVGDRSSAGLFPVTRYRFSDKDAAHSIS